MRKSLLLFMAVLLPMALGAQLVASPSLWQQGGSLKSFEGRHMAPAQADLGENQLIMGHYDTDDVSTDGLGMTSSPGVIPIGVILEPDELEVFQGGKIVAFRVGLAASTPVTRVFVIPVNASGGYGTTTEWACNVNKVGWNVVELETPYEINLEADQKLMIGFDYTQTATNYPISAVQVGKAYDAYIYTKVNPRVYQWQPVGLISYGNLSVQCIVESENFPDYLLEMSDLVSPNYLKDGDVLEYSFKLRNKGVQHIDPQAFVANVMVDGNQVATITNNDVVNTAFTTMTGSVPLTGLQSGAHSLAITAAMLNGEEIAEPQTLETTFKVISDIIPRQKHLIEQLTSTYCTYCPLGISLLRLLTSQRDDIIWVGLHGNMNGVDPFRSDQCDTILTYLTGGSISYPSGAFDRSTGWEDDNTIANGLGYYEQYHRQVAAEVSNFLDYISEAVPNFATIEGECLLSEEGHATVTISGELTPDFDVMAGTDAKLTVYVLEDNLVARQLNLGNWVEDFVHNGVFRYAPASVFGVPLNKSEDGATYSNTFNFDIDWEYGDMSNLRIVAFISRPLRNSPSGFSDMYVLNAESFDFSVGEGVEEILTTGDLYPVAFYDVMGRTYDSLHLGVNIVRMSDGTTRKILVK